MTLEINVKSINETYIIKLEGIYTSYSLITHSFFNTNLNFIFLIHKLILNILLNSPSSSSSLFIYFLLSSTKYHIILFKINIIFLLKINNNIQHLTQNNNI